MKCDNEEFNIKSEEHEEGNGNSFNILVKSLAMI